MNGNNVAIGEQNALSTAFSTIARSTEATDRETFSRKIRLPRTTIVSKDFAYSLSNAKARFADLRDRSCDILRRSRYTSIIAIPLDRH